MKNLHRDDSVEGRSGGARSCDAPVAEGAGDASSQKPIAQPNGAPRVSRDEASQLLAAANGWLSSKIGTEFSVFSGVDFNTENTGANYQSGDIFHVDATLAQHLPLFGGIAGAGASAFYLKQFTGDSGSGAKLGSFEAESYGVGPTISYSIPSANIRSSWMVPGCRSCTLRTRPRAIISGSKS